MDNLICYDYEAVQGQNSVRMCSLMSRHIFMCQGTVEVFGAGHFFWSSFCRLVAWCVGQEHTFFAALANFWAMKIFFCHFTYSRGLSS